MKEKFSENRVAYFIGWGVKIKKIIVEKLNNNNNKKNPRS
jgi:hypothetical protein